MVADIIVQDWPHSVFERKATAKRHWDVGIVDILPESRQNLRAQKNYHLFCCARVDPLFQVFPYRGEIRRGIAYLSQLMLVMLQTAGMVFWPPTKIRSIVSG